MGGSGDHRWSLPQHRNDTSLMMDTQTPPRPGQHQQHQQQHVDYGVYTPSWNRDVGMVSPVLNASMDGSTSSFNRSPTVYSSPTYQQQQQPPLTNFPNPHIDPFQPWMRADASYVPQQHHQQQPRRASQLAAGIFAMQQQHQLQQGAISQPQSPSALWQGADFSFSPPRLPGSSSRSPVLNPSMYPPRSSPAHFRRVHSGETVATTSSPTAAAALRPRTSTSAAISKSQSRGWIHFSCTGGYTAPCYHLPTV